jgi:hypothetical protein
MRMRTIVSGCMSMCVQMCMCIIHMCIVLWFVYGTYKTKQAIRPNTINCATIKSLVRISLWHPPLPVVRRRVHPCQAIRGVGRSIWPNLSNHTDKYPDEHLSNLRREPIQESHTIDVCHWYEQVVYCVGCWLFVSRLNEELLLCQLIRC